MSTAIIGSIVLVLLMFFFLYFKPVPGAQVGLFANLAASFLSSSSAFFLSPSARASSV